MIYSKIEYEIWRDLECSEIYRERELVEVVRNNLEEWFTDAVSYELVAMMTDEYLIEAVLFMANRWRVLNQD